AELEAERQRFYSSWDQEDDEPQGGTWGGKGGGPGPNAAVSDLGGHGGGAGPNGSYTPYGPRPGHQQPYNLTGLYIVLEGIGWGLVAFDVANTPVSPTPDAGIVGAGMITGARAKLGHLAIAASQRG